MLEQLGLVSALTELARRFADQSGIQVERRFAEDLPPLSEEAELAIYRVAQESLTNVARHAQASRVELALEPGAGDGAAINVGTGRATTVLEVADVLARHLGVDLEPEIRNEFRAGDIRHCVADVTRARERLGYEPKVEFEDGMRELAEWLSGQEAEDLVDKATEALVRRGLTL
jgi:dTDP-L-rhamnose 4-epimerase